MKNVIKRTILLFVVILFIGVTKSFGVYNFNRKTEACTKGHENCTVVTLYIKKGENEPLEERKFHFRDKAPKILMEEAGKLKKELAGLSIIQQNKGIYCLNHDVNIPGEVQINLMNRINIKNENIENYTYAYDGNVEKIETFTDDIGYVAGYLFAQANTGPRGHSKSPVQYALWSKKVYKEATGANKLGPTFAQILLPRLKVNVQATGMHAVDPDWKEPTQLLKASIKYRDIRKEYNKIEKQQTTPGIKIVGNDLIVGPFNVKYSNLVNPVDNQVIAGIDSYSLTDKYGNQIPYLICEEKSGAYQTINKIPNGTNFYLKLAKDVTSIGKFTVLDKVMDVEALMYVMRSSAQSQDQLFIMNGKAPYVTHPVSWDINYEPSGNISITKVEADTQKAMAGVEFTMKMTSGPKNGYYVGVNTNGQATYSATEIRLKTNASGVIQIQNVLEGNFQLREVSIPSQYAGYKYPIDLGTFTVKVGETYTISLKNERYVNIQGRVWEDRATDSKLSNYNHVLGNEDSFNTAGVKVHLLKDGVRIDSYSVGTDGIYIFKDIRASEIGKYHLEYEYNGMKYRSVNLQDENTRKKNDSASRASDISSSRDAINTNFSTINPNSGITYVRDNNKYTSTVKYDGNGIGYQSSQTKYNVTASTEGVYDLTWSPAASDISNNTIIVNFGLIERIQPDLAVTKDVQNVKVSVKDDRYNQLYTYGERVHQDDLNKKFNDNLTYTRNLYASDIAYGDPDYGNVEGQTGKQLEVKVTYKIGLKNKTSLKASINKLRDFYSVEYGVSGITIGKINEQTGEFTETYNNQISITNNSGIQGYNKLEINKPFTIAPNKTEYIYVQFTVPREALKDLLNNAKVKEMQNFVEIEEYTTRDGEGKLYGGIDKNSQPGNMIPENKSTYEDDNDKAPALKIGLKAEREMSGNVFLDETNETTQQGQERQGDGIYKEGERLINVEKVELYEIQSDGTLKQAKVFNKDTKTFTEANLANISGYNIKGFLPGRYVLKYTWGNGETTYYEIDGQKVIISSQKYKGTIFNQEKHQGEDWYTKDVETRYTDATDDYERRKQIDAQTLSMTNKTIRESKNANNAMTSQTPIMDINLEYGAVVTISYAKEKQVYIIENGQVKYDQDGYAQVKEGQEVYKVKNVDFGIVERARQELKLDKYVQHITIFGTDGNRLVDAERNAEGKLETTYLTYIPAGPSAEAQIKVELDKELMQNSNISIVYNFKITNIGEIDYSNEQYYKYGNNKNANDLVRLKPDRIIDYVDDTIEAYEANNSNWNFIETSEDKKELVENLGLVENIEQLERTKKVAIMKDLMDETSKGLAPGDVLTNKGDDPISITSSKLMTTSNDGLESQNFAEIIEVIRNGEGAVLHESVLGNYDVENYKTVEPDSSYSERVIVIPATGENRNFALYTIIGISSLAVIALGIVLIKKKTIK